jgi:AraC-like DNA-binding protein
MLMEETIAKKKRYKSNREFDKQLMSFLENNYNDTDLQVERICDALIMSRTHLHRKAKEYYGKSIIEIVTEFRLEKAKTVLTSKTKIKEVAFQVGFKDAKYFSRVFRKKTGIHPKEFIV